jgi:hypothetical protein
MGLSPRREALYTVRLDEALVRMERMRGDEVLSIVSALDGFQGLLSETFDGKISIQIGDIAEARSNLLFIQKRLPHIAGGKLLADLLQKTASQITALDVLADALKPRSGESRH